MTTRQTSRIRCATGAALTVAALLAGCTSSPDATPTPATASQSATATSAPSQPSEQPSEQPSWQPSEPSVVDMAGVLTVNTGDSVVRAPESSGEDRGVVGWSALISSPDSSALAVYEQQLLGFGWQKVKSRPDSVLLERGAESLALSIAAGTDGQWSIGVFYADASAATPSVMPSATPSDPALNGASRDQATQVTGAISSTAVRGG